MTRLDAACLLALGACLTIRIPLIPLLILIGGAFLLFVMGCVLFAR